ncbi:hypothetical protein AB0H83_13245 [Dactylosporangium sp. NPDC050688]|uniref:hypothetical protein n=1 Tax=Dactylosporangium sp. NPDC050688 TaxID=3157217 RepID=UPI0033DBCBF6
MAADDGSRPWRSVPDAQMNDWGDVFDASQEGETLSSPCPVCGATTLHRWFDLHRADPRTVAGLPWQGRGSQWQWCSTCRSYLHTSGLVPLWWTTTIEVDPEVLTHSPGPIEEVIARTR